MLDNRDMKKAFGESDAGFRENFDHALQRVQTGQIQRRITRFGVIPILAALAMCLLLSTVVFAVVSNNNRVDTIVGKEGITTPAADEYELIGEDGYISAYMFDRPVEMRPYINAKMAGRLIEAFDYGIFVGLREPINPFVPVPGADGMYWFEDKSQILYCGSSASESYRISGLIFKIDADFNGIEWNYGLDYPNRNYISQEEAAGYLGKAFRLPEQYLLDQKPVKFTAQQHNSGSKSVYVRMGGVMRYLYSALLFIETPRREGIEPFLWDAEEYAVVNEWEVAGTTIYKAVQKDVCTRYVWVKDGLTYILFQWYEAPNQPTDAECAQIIKSMIE